MKTLKGYKIIGFSDLHPPYTEIISLPLEGAKFLTGWKLIAAHRPICLMLKEKNLVIPDGYAITEPILYV